MTITAFPMRFIALLGALIALSACQFIVLEPPISGGGIEAEYHGLWLMEAPINDEVNAKEDEPAPVLVAHIAANTITIANTLSLAGMADEANTDDMHVAINCLPVIASHEARHCQVHNQKKDGTLSKDAYYLYAMIAPESGHLYVLHPSLSDKEDVAYWRNELDSFDIDVDMPSKDSNMTLPQSEFLAYIEAQQWPRAASYIKRTPDLSTPMPHYLVSRYCRLRDEALRRHIDGLKTGDASPLDCFN